MRSLSPQAVLEKNKLYGNPFILCIVLELPDGEKLTLCQYNKEIQVGDFTYYPFPIHLGEIKENNKGELIEIPIQISNVAQELIPYIEQYDGLVGQTVYLLWVFKNSNGEYEIAIWDKFQITSSSYDEKTIDFNLGHYNLLDVLTPQRKVIEQCQWEFKSPECGYTGSDTSCGKNFWDCIQKGNEKRFGGFPTIQTNRVYL